MAKALIGHLHGDQTARLLAENARLRRRVLDLETLVLRLQTQNDELAAASVEQAIEEMQPV